MADFVEEDAADNVGEKYDSSTTSEFIANVNFDSPKSVTYCGVCTMPVEYCEFGASFDKCKEWRESALEEDELADLVGKASLEEEGEGEDDKKKSKKVKAAKKSKVVSIDDCRVIIARIQRQKRKFVTAVAGLESVPDLKIKDAAKAFGKKFASGAAVSETATGAKEVVIQGDVCYKLPALLKNVFKVPQDKMFFLEDKKLVPVG